jgi:hypothetical protein
MLFVFFISDLAQLDDAAPERGSAVLEQPPNKAGARPRFIGGGHERAADRVDGGPDNGGGHEVIVNEPPSAPHTPQPLAVAAFGERVKNAFEHGQGTYGCHYYGFGLGEPGGLEPPVGANELHFGSSRGDGLGARGDEYLWDQKQAAPAEPKHVGSSMADGLGVRGDEYLWQNKASRGQMDITQILVRLADQGGKKETASISVPSQRHLGYQGWQNHGRPGVSFAARPPMMSHSSPYRRDPGLDRVDTGIFGSLHADSTLSFGLLPGPAVLPVHQLQRQMPTFVSPPVHQQPFRIAPQQMPLQAVAPQLPMFLSQGSARSAAYTPHSGSFGAASPSISYPRPNSFASSAPRKGRYTEQYV